ncbi:MULTISPECIES: hypothetical protein [Bacillaceae]|uniref:hypothetical protein n=1 Tax=Bacillaceae TaxID=186817 RepID=UPI0001E890A1|nr:hypothetical protein [Bacillus sp. m3-13]
MNYYHYSGQPKPTAGQVKVISSSNKSSSSNKKKKSSGCGCGKKAKVIQED